MSRETNNRNMFYNIENQPENTLEKDFFLIDNFLKEVPNVVNKIAIEFQDMAQDEIDDMKEFINLKEIIESQFKFLLIANRDFKIEQVANPKELYKKLSDNGLAGESLYAKLQVLDWLWKRAKEKFVTLMSGLNNSLYASLINQIKSILGSILNALGINSDIYDEAMDLLFSFKELCVKTD